MLRITIDNKQVDVEDDGLSRAEFVDSVAKTEEALSICAAKRNLPPALFDAYMRILKKG